MTTLPLHRPRVCVVEDNPDNRLLLQAMLGERYDITEFESGLAALAGLASARPDVLLLDISLPGMDGVELLSRLRADADLAHLPAIALTAHAMTMDREKFLAAGFDGYVAKPIVDEDVLVDAIEGLIARNTLR